MFYYAQNLKKEYRSCLLIAWVGLNIKKENKMLYNIHVATMHLKLLFKSVGMIKKNEKNATFSFIHVATV